MPARIFTAAKHPKSFVSLAGADHLLSRRSDAAYVANVIDAWAGRYLDSAGARARAGRNPDDVVVRESRQGRFQQEITVGPHRLLADEPRDRRSRQRSGALRPGAGGPRRLHGDDASSLRRAQGAAARSGHGRAQPRQDPRPGLRGLRDQGGMIDRIERAITLAGDLDAAHAPAAHGDRRQMPGAPYADLGDRHPHGRTAQRR